MLLSSSLLLSKSVSLIRRRLLLEVASLGFFVLGFKVCRNVQPWHGLDWRDLVLLSLVFIRRRAVGLNAVFAKRCTGGDVLALYLTFRREWGAFHR